MSTQALAGGATAPYAPVVAALLSVIAPGVGQFYAGRIRRGLALFAVLLAIEGALVGAALLVPPSFAAVMTFGVVAVTATLGLYLFMIFDAARLARGGSRPYPWYVLLAAVAGIYLVAEIAVMAVPAIRALQPWRTFDVASASMEPTLRPGEIFIADTRYFAANAPRRGDVVVYRLPKDPDTIFVKRIVALAGDRVSFRNGRILIGGAAVSEPYVKVGDPAARFNSLAEFRVPANTVFVSGDNRDNSVDSRDLAGHGPVPVENLVGRATEVLMSALPDRAGRWVGTPR